jgi:hypothetical protein
MEEKASDELIAFTHGPPAAAGLFTIIITEPGPFDHYLIAGRGYAVVDIA